MKETRIRLNMDDVHDFVKAATKCDFDIDVRYNRFLVDAKSILGVLSMDLGQILIVKCHGENSDFDSFLEKHKVAYERKRARGSLLTLGERRMSIMKLCFMI